MTFKFGVINSNKDFNFEECLLFNKLFRNDFFNFKSKASCKESTFKSSLINS